MYQWRDGYSVEPPYRYVKYLAGFRTTISVFVGRVSVLYSTSQVFGLRYGYGSLFVLFKNLSTEGKGIQHLEFLKCMGIITLGFSCSQTLSGFAALEVTFPINGMPINGRNSTSTCPSLRNWR